MQRTLISAELLPEGPQPKSRPVWKPMHLQPLYARCQHNGGRVAEGLVHRGICLPSSSSLPLEDQLYVVNQVRAAADDGPPQYFEEPCLFTV